VSAGVLGAMLGVPALWGLCGECFVAALFVGDPLPGSRLWVLCFLAYLTPRTDQGWAFGDCTVHSGMHDMT
jgi:hypothetical protein